MLSIHEPSARKCVANLSPGVTPDIMVRFNAYYASVSPLLACSDHRPIGLAAHSESIVPRAALFKTDYYNDFLKPLEIDGAIGLTLERTGDRHTVLSVYIPTATWDRDAEAVERMQRLAPICFGSRS